MDRLVSVTPKEISLKFDPSTRCFATITVTSLMHTMAVAVHISTTRPHIFSLSPPTPLLLPPLSSTSFTISLSSSSHPPLTSPLDSLLVKSAIFTLSSSSKPSASALLRLFSAPTAAHVFKDASVPISFVGPHALDALLLSPSNQTSAFLITKAIPSCSPDDLSALLRRAAAASRPSLISVLLSAGADPSSRGPDGRSALSHAVSSGNYDAVRMLHDAGAEIDFALDLSFHEAAAANRTDLIDLIKQPDWAGTADPGGRTPVHYAAANGHADAVSACLDSGGDADAADSYGWTPLHCAAVGGSLEVVELLIERSAYDPRLAVTADGGKTALDQAAEAGHSQLLDALGIGDELLRAARRGDLEGVKECVRRGAGVERRDANGWTALHRAAFKGRMEIVRFLVESGANLEAVDDVGFTPLRCAVEAGQFEVALMLVGLGAQKRLKGVKKGADLFKMRLDCCIGADGATSLCFNFSSD